MQLASKVMTSKAGCRGALASTLRAALHSCHALLLVLLCSAAVRASTKQEADPAAAAPVKRFEVQGRLFHNRSLGYDQQAPGMLGHQCSPARPGPHPKSTLTYTANRRWPEQADEGRSAIMMAVGGEPHRFFDRIQDAWFEWRMWFTRDIRHNTAIILLLDANFYSGVDGVAEALKLDAVDCGAFADACRVAAALDQGYKVFTLTVYANKRTGKPQPEPKEPLVVFIGVAHFPPPFWVARSNRSEAEVVAEDWKTLRCNHANYAYTKFTNWYSYHMLADLRLLDFFDYFWKVDDDVRWFGPLPLDITPALVEQKAIWFHTALAADPWDCIGPPLAESVDLFLDVESARCGRPLRAVAEGAPWFHNDSTVYLSEFVGGWLGLYTSPELLQYARLWNYMPDGMWEWRWGDQQFWTKANGLFDDGSHILDWSAWKEHDPNVLKGLPDKSTGMIFYHGL